MGHTPPVRLDELCSGVIRAGYSAQYAGWVIHDGFLDSIRLWQQYLQTIEPAHQLIKITAVGGPRVPGIDLQPLAAQLGDGRLPDPEAASPGQRHFAVLAHLRQLLGGQRGLPVVLIQQPGDIDEFSQRVLTSLALESRLRLVLHLPPGDRLPQRWNTLERNGQLISCPILRITAEQIPEFCEELTGGAVVPELSAIAAHQATGGEIGVLQTLLQHAEPTELAAVLATGSYGKLSHSEELRSKLRLRRARLRPPIRHLLDLCALAGHLPLPEARQLSSRGAIDELLALGLLRTVSCTGNKVLAFSGTLIGQYWAQLLPNYESTGLQQLLNTTTGCCQLRNLHRYLSQVDHPDAVSTEQLLHSLQLADDQGNFSAAESFATTLGHRLATSDSAAQYQRTLIALAQHAADTQGPYQALRVLNTRTGPHRYDWQDPRGRALIVQQNLESGRLLPTVQRLAQVAQLPVPTAHGDNAFWELLPQDALREHMRRGLHAALRANLRGAAVHFVAGLRKCRLEPQLPNARTLRTSFLANAAYTLALGGYHEQWEELRRHLAEYPEPWHARVCSGWRAAHGVIQFHRGALEDGRRSLSEAAQLANLVDQSNLWEAGHAVELWLEAQKLSEESTRAQTAFPLNDLLSFGRNAVEEALNHALTREPEALETLLPLVHNLPDPRGGAIHLAALADLGRSDPVQAAHTLDRMGQGFLALWVIDGILLRRMIVHRGELALPGSRRIEELMAFSAELIRRCQNLEFEPLPAELVRILRGTAAQSLAVLPFAANEARRRRLTQRETQILKLVRNEATNKQIARELTVSVRTVEGHIAAILDKYALSSRGLLLNERPNYSAGVTRPRPTT